MHFFKKENRDTDVPALPRESETPYICEKKLWKCFGAITYWKYKRKEEGSKMKLAAPIVLILWILPGVLQAQTMRLDAVPARASKAVTGTVFARQTADLSGRERQMRAVAELRRGNMPDFLRNLKPVRLTYKPADADTVVAVIWVTPDYLAIGSNNDFLRMPLTYPSATAIATVFGCVLPTKKMVDAIYAQATCHLAPDPMPAGPQMRSIAYYLTYRQKIRAQRQQIGGRLGELTAGHKKDVVLTDRLNSHPGRIAIYGWHRLNGHPIQPLSTVHGARYADYSHGIRLVYQTVTINGKPYNILDALKNPALAPVLNDEGIIPNPRKLMGVKTPAVAMNGAR